MIKMCMRFVLLVVVVLVAACSKALCVPDSISYQGRLTNSSGIPVVDGAYQVQFKLYTVMTDGTAFKTSNTMDITTAGGVFTTQIKPVLVSDLSGKTNVWVETSVRTLSTDPWQVLSPRAMLESVPFAIQAADLSLPFAGSVLSSTPAFSVTNSGTGPAAVFSGNVGIGTASPAGKLEVLGNVRISGIGNGIVFSDGTTQTTAALPGVPTGASILGDSSTPPSGYSYTGNYLTIQKFWKEKTSMPTARGSAACGMVSNKIYVIGGQDTNYNRFANNEMYDPATDTWTTRAALPTARSGLAAAVVNGKIYAIGGHDGTSTQSRVDEYDPATNLWTAKTAMPTARQLFAAAVVNNKIYAMGGMDSTQAESIKVEEYNPATNTWATMANLSSARKSFGAAVVNSVIYICGGFAPASVVTKTESWAPGSSSWFPLTDMATARANCAMVEMNSLVYAIGGSDGKFSTTNNEAYIGYSHAWSIRPSSLNPRNSAVAAVVNGKIYVIGGYADGTVTLSSVEEYDPAATTINYYVHKKN